MNLKEYKTKKMNDPEFAKAYEEIQPEMNVIRAIIDARISQNMTQKELAERTGIAQTEISKLENGTRNPSMLIRFYIFPTILSGYRSPKYEPTSARLQLRLQR